MEWSADEEVRAGLESRRIRRCSHGVAPGVRRGTALRGPCRGSFGGSTLPTNRASLRVMQKAGLTYEREIFHERLRHVLFRTSPGKAASLTRQLALPAAVHTCS